MKLRQTHQLCKTEHREEWMKVSDHADKTNKPYIIKNKKIKKIKIVQNESIKPVLAKDLKKGFSFQFFHYCNRY